MTEAPIVPADAVPEIVVLDAVIEPSPIDDHVHRTGYGACTMCTSCQGYTGGWANCQNCGHPFDRHR